MCTYTSVLLADTAVPSWHEAYPELPFVFGGSAMTTAAGAAMLCTAPKDHLPARRMGWIGAGMEIAASVRMERAHGLVSEPYREGTAGQLLRDKQLYENMNGAVAEMRGLVKDIRADPKKYLNVRVSLF